MIWNVSLNQLRFSSCLYLPYPYRPSSNPTSSIIIVLLYVSCGPVVLLDLYIFFSQGLKQSYTIITIILICNWGNNHRKLTNDLNTGNKWQGQYSRSGLLDLTVEPHHTGFPWSLLDWTSYTSPHLTLSQNRVFCIGWVSLVSGSQSHGYKSHILGVLTLLGDASFLLAKLYFTGFSWWVFVCLFYLMNAVQEQVSYFS